MSYIQELRAAVGSRPIILAGACVIILDAEGRLLLQLRTDNGTWGIPGGSMEPGERIEETARREAFEETGLTVGALTLFGVFSGPEHFYTYPNGDQIYDLCVAYIATEAVGTLRGDEESHELRYFPLDSLPQNLNSLDIPILSKLIQSPPSPERGEQNQTGTGR